MTEFMIHTITSTTTGEPIRYVIAPAAVTLGLGVDETVSAREPLAARFDLPVSVVCRKPPMDRRLRIQIENWRAEQGGEAPEPVDGNELAVAFFQLDPPA